MVATKVNARFVIMPASGSVFDQNNSNIIISVCVFIINFYFLKSH